MNDDETTLPQPPKVAKPAGAAKKQVDYVVTISRITDRYDLMGLGFAESKGMKPDETREFEVKAKVAHGARQCTHNVQYGTVK